MIQLTDVTRTVILQNGTLLPILKGVNLQIQPGEHVAIIGQSGTGKSTLLNILGLLDLPNTGTYLLNGQNVAQLKEGKRAALRGDIFGFVFQQFNLFPSRTALENVEVPLLYGSTTDLYQRKEIAAKMLEQVGLGDRLDAMPGHLSGGEQQRVAIARALVRTPKVILADEPTGALDLNTGRLVMELLEYVAAKYNAALVVITHDIQVAMRAKTIYEIRDGQICAPELLRNYQPVDPNLQFPQISPQSQSFAPTPGTDLSAEISAEAEVIEDAEVDDTFATAEVSEEAEITPQIESSQS